MKSHHILCIFCYSLSLSAAAVSLSATDPFGFHLWADIVIARLNDKAIDDENASLSAADFVDRKAKISAGKKRHALIVLDQPGST